MNRSVENKKFRLSLLLDAQLLVLLINAKGPRLLRILKVDGTELLTGTNAVVEQIAVGSGVQNELEFRSSLFGVVLEICRRDIFSYPKISSVII